MVKFNSKLFKGVLALELAGVIGAYLLYFRMDSSQGQVLTALHHFTDGYPTPACADFRHTMNRRFPSVLEVYYKSNEWAGIHGIRERDALAWETRKN
ncbi:protein CEBPZOS isoform X1 [Bufo gargarizans]|uniref:protein CEBPZOS isoform X1 n=1 Tax=Bufo gargarizans TaxID=30331 RepID=UPI001CF5BC2E|nr:protein CEBPZOS isoform X1 [Bufo gargarizans]